MEVVAQADGRQLIWNTPLLGRCVASAAVCWAHVYGVAIAENWVTGSITQRYKSTARVDLVAHSTKAESSFLGTARTGVAFNTYRSSPCPRFDRPKFGNIIPNFLYH